MQKPVPIGPPANVVRVFNPCRAPLPAAPCPSPASASKEASLFMALSSKAGPRPGAIPVELTQPQAAAPHSARRRLAPGSAG
eukprot:1204105-Alexandrium_andersonii.AAC.1